MQELTMQEIDEVNGGATVSGAIAMTLAAGWAGAVVSFAAGSIVPGFGNAAGAGVGAFVGIAVGIGLFLPTPELAVF